MLNKKLEDAINEQITAELYSAYLYLSMAAYFSAMNLSGFENWMKVQTQEELFHGMKFYTYVNEKGGRVVMEAIEKPDIDWANPASVFEHIYKHEQKVTALINSLMDLAIQENDHATNIFLQWFVTEQVEEEASASDILEKLKMIGNNSNALLMLDKELGARVFTAPPTEK